MGSNSPDGQRVAFVTGAGGFIGRHAVDALLRQNWRVGALGPHTASLGCAAAREDMTSVSNLAALAETLGAPHAVIHCAGGASVGPSWSDPGADFAMTLGSVNEALAFIRAHAPAARLVFLSSAAVYGDAGGALLHEDMAKRPMSPYGAHKALAEDLIQHWGRLFGVQSTILRLFSVYGPGLRKQLPWELSARALAAGAPPILFGSGEEQRDFLAIEDAVTLILRAADPALSPPAILNGGAGEAIKIRTLAAQLLASLGIAGDPRFSGEAKAGDPLSLVADTARAKAFGFNPETRLHQGLARYAAWVRTAFHA
jgi:UDP-glucose 4-epimerase